MLTHLTVRRVLCLRFFELEDDGKHIPNPFHRSLVNDSGTLPMQ